MKRNIVSDITQLYELALSFGNSFDINENCDSFLTTLMSRKNLEFASVWIKNEFIPGNTSKDNCSIVYSNPRIRNNISEIPTNHHIFILLENSRALVLKDSDSDYKKLIFEKRTEKGAFIIFRLDEIGFIKLYTSFRYDEYDNLEINKLINIISKFTLTLKSCLHYSKSIFNANERIRQEHQHRILFNNNPLPMFIYNIENMEFMDVNNTFLAKYNATREEFLNSVVFDYIPPTALPHNLIPEDEWNSSTSKTREWIHKLRDGSKINVEITGSVIDYKGQKACVVLIHDITERKAVQKAVKVSKDNFKSFFNSNRDFLWVIDKELNILNINKTFTDKLGFKREEVIGKKISGFFISEDDNTGLEDFTDLVLGKVENCEIPIINKDGNLTPVESNVTVGIWNNKEAYFGISKDVSQLKASEEKFEKLFQTSPTIAFLSNYKTGEIIDVNKAFCKATLYNKKRLEALTVKSLFTYKDDDHYSDLLAEIKKNRRLRNIEMVMQKKDGSLFPVLANGDIITINNTAILFVVAIDITDMKIAENKLKESEQKYRLIFNSIVDVYAEIDLRSGNIIEISPSIKLISGYTREEMIGTNMEDYYYNKSDREKLFDKLRETGVVNDFEVTLVNKYGNAIPSSFSIKLVFDNNNKPYKVVGTMRNISDRKKSEESLAKLSTAVEQNPLGIVITDSDGIIEYINRAFTNITGFTYDDAFGYKTNILRSNSNPTDIYGEMWKTLISGNIWHGELVNRKKNGDHYYASLAIAPIKTDEGKITNYVGIQQDISQTKQLEKDLTLAKESAEAASEAKARFLAIMSHEMRSPLNAIIGFISLLNETPLDDNQLSFTSKLEESAKILFKLINEVLDFTKIEQGSIQIENTIVNLEHVIKRVINNIEEKAEERSNTISYTIDNDIPDRLIGDPTRIFQIINNLASNAVKFTEDGIIQIDISMIEKIEDEFHMKFVVRDSGIGIRPENVDKVFESFKQEDESTTRKYGGTGLGLAISKQLVELMGGTIGLNSAVGEGSEFYFDLRLNKAKLEEVTEEPKKVLEVVDLSGLRILYAEDNQLNQDVAKALMKKLNINLEIVENGIEAIEALRKDQGYDIILMDIQMPVMGGLEATSIIRKEISKEIPIIALTANVLVETIKKCEEVGMNDFIAKPFDKSILIEKLSQYTNRSESTTDNENSKYSGTIIQNTNSNITNAERLYDLTFLKELFDNDHEAVNKLINKFIEMTPEYLDELMFSMEKHDLEDVGDIAHKLKSQIKTIGTSGIIEVITNIELFAKSNEMVDKIPGMIDNFVQLSKELLSQLKIYLND